MRHTHLKFIGAGLGLCWTVLLLGIFFSTPAWAHASLIGTEPADGTLLLVAPDFIVLKFSEPVSPLVIGIIQPDGTRLPLDKFEAKGAELRTTMPHGLGTGTHVLTWRVVSEDGHPIGGSVVFSIGRHTEPPSETTSLDNPAVMALLWAGKVALYLGLFLGIGGVFAQQWLFLHHRPARWPVVMCFAIGLLSLPVLLAAQGLDALGLPPSELARWHVWKAAVGTSLGPALFVAGCALAIAALSLAGTGIIARGLALIALVGAGIALACTGHASSAPPHILTRPMVALHGMAVAFWLGALYPMQTALRSKHPEAIPALLRFSRAVPAILAVLILAGMGLAYIQLGGIIIPLLTVPYGRLLAIKLGLVAILLLLGALNRWRLTLPVAQGSARERAQLVRSVCIELVIGLAILGVVAGWRFTPPPRNVVQGEPVSLHLHSEKVMAHVMASTDRAGPTTLTFMLISPNGSAIAAKELSVDLTLPKAGIEPMRRKAEQDKTEAWVIKDVVIPLPGIWTIGVNVLVSDFESVKLSGEMTFH